MPQRSWFSGRLAPLAICALVAGAVLAVPAGAQVSLHGKTINIIVNSPAGGGTDTIARLVGTSFVRHLPGQPTVVFRNLPGGGGIQANNFFYTQVPPDGSTLLSGSRSQISPAKLVGGAIKYNPADYRFVGGTGRLGTVILVRRDAKDRFVNGTGQPLVYGDVDGERSGLVAVMWAKEYLNWNIRFVVGYASSGALSLAGRRGEIDMVGESLVANLQAMIDDGLYPALQFGAPDSSDRRAPRAAFPDVPIFDDVLLPKLSGKALKAYQSWRDDQLIDKWLALPPKTPNDIVEAYREAYMKAASDPKIVEINKKAYGEDLPNYSGALVDKIVKGLVATEEEDLAFLIALKKKHGLPVN